MYLSPTSNAVLVSHLYEFAHNGAMIVWVPGHFCKSFALHSIHTRSLICHCREEWFCMPDWVWFFLWYLAPLLISVQILCQFSACLFIIKFLYIFFAHYIVSKDLFTMSSSISLFQFQVCSQTIDLSGTKKKYIYIYLSFPG